MTPIIMNRANSNIIAKNNISGPAPNPYIVDQTALVLKA